MVSRLTGAALTQKSHPRLALCKPSFLPCPSGGAAATGMEGYVVQVEAPGMSPLQLPLFTPSTGTLATSDANVSNASQQERAATSRGGSSCTGQENSDQVRSVRVCLNCQEGVSCSPEADAWFSAYLGTMCYFVRTPKHQQPNSTNWKKSFSNEAQFLILSVQSVQNLHQKVRHPCSIMETLHVAYHCLVLYRSCKLETHRTAQSTRRLNGLFVQTLWSTVSTCQLMTKTSGSLWNCRLRIAM